MTDRVSRYYGVVVKWIERLLALVLLGGVVVSAVGSAQVLSNQDWQRTETFYDLIYRMLLLVIGLELVRMLVVHDLMAVLELLAVVIARKMLKPDLSAIDIILAVLGFVALLAARRFALGVTSQQNEDSSSLMQREPLGPILKH